MEHSLSKKPILLFLHGVGNGDHDDKWKTYLENALLRLGYPDLDSVQIIAPKYAHALKGWDQKELIPGVTIKPLLREAGRDNRRDFERRTAAVEFRLGRHELGNGRLGGEVLINAAVGLPGFSQARNYLRDTQIRAQVLNRVLAQLPDSGRIVVIGHSLGSVIAADLVRRLPVGLSVAGMVTIGSPLASGSFDVDKLRDSLQEPPSNLDWWVNFWNVLDPVAAHRGVSSVFPWIIDFRINTKAPLQSAHNAVEYLGNGTVAAAVGFALFGSKSKELASIEIGLDVPLDHAEQMALAALSYAHMARTSLKGDLQDRFAGALRQVQATVVEEIRSRNITEGRPMPSAIARLAFDFSNPGAMLPEPTPSSHLTKEDAIVLLTVLATENVLKPFEIVIPRDKWRDAMKNLTAEMKLGSQYGDEIFDAVKDAQDALNRGRGTNWIKWGALGAGAAALIVATGGLALAAAPGLAGAAVITSALASFGPGGMIGGLLTAGTLVTAGRGGIAFGLASPGTSAETLEDVIVRRLAVANLRRREGLTSDPIVWRVLVETEIEIRREHERLDEFSDEASPALKELKRKIETVERALKYLREIGLEPSVPADVSDETD